MRKSIKQTIIGSLAGGVIVFSGAAPLNGSQEPPASQPEKQKEKKQNFSLLVFSKTAGFRHGSIPDGIREIEELGDKFKFKVDATENSEDFTTANLSQYAAVVFLSTTGDVLNDEQQDAFEQYIKAGGGYVGVHAASDTEYNWPWYGKLVGAYFSGHPPGLYNAKIEVENRKHPSTQHLPRFWDRKDEWYNYRNSVRKEKDFTVLASLDESSYQGGTMEGDHPIAWCHEFEGGRAWYTGGGHTKESFTKEPLFLKHLLGGIKWAAGMEDSKEKKPRGKKDKDDGGPSISGGGLDVNDDGGGSGDREP